MTNRSRFLIMTILALAVTAPNYAFKFWERESRLSSKKKINLRTSDTSASSNDIGYFYDGIKVGDLDYADANKREASGITNPTLAANAGYLWFQADGSVNNLYVTKQSTGGHFGTWALSGVSGTDFEDLSSVRVGTTSWIYLADTGNNANAQGTFTIYKIREPVITGVAGTIAAADIIPVVSTFPAVPTHRDVECLMADPITGDMYIITKRFTPPNVYRLEYQESYTNPISTWTLMGATWGGFTNDVPYDNANGGYVTGCNIRPDGKEILIRNHDKVWIFTNYASTKTVYDMIASTGSGGRQLGESVRGGRPSSLYNNEAQAEAITYDENSEDFWTVSEAGTFDQTGASATNFPLRKYDRLTVAYSTISLQVGTSGFPTTSSYDTYIQSTTPTTNYGVSQSSMVADEDATDTRVSMVRFDTDGYVPYGATITGGDLLLFINTEGQDFTVHKILKPWDEALVTYANFNPTGGPVRRDDITLSASSEATHGSPTSVAANHGYNAITGQVKIKLTTATLQAYSDGTPNFGWAIFNAGTSLDGFQFSTKENVTVSQRPIMAIRYHGGFTLDPAVVAWWSASDITSIPNASTVTYWTDRSASVNIASQAIAANRPLMWVSTVSGSNNMPALSFNGTTQFSTFTQISGTDATVIFVGTNTVYGGMILGRATGIGHILNVSATETRAVSVVGTTVWTHAALTPFDIQVFRFDNTTLNVAQHWVNGVESTRSGASQQIFTEDQIGQHNGSDYFNGYIGDLLIANTGLSSSLINTYSNYFATKYGKTWTNIP